LLLLHDCAHDIQTEKISFADACRWPVSGGYRGGVGCGGGTRHGSWISVGGGVRWPDRAEGGFLTHHIPAGRCFYGSSREYAAARFSPENVRSQKALEKAGLLPCGRILVGKV
jgi:hypothetical protein